MYLLRKKILRQGGVESLMPNQPVFDQTRLMENMGKEGVVIVFSSPAQAEGIEQIRNK